MQPWTPWSLSPGGTCLTLVTAHMSQGKGHAAMPSSVLAEPQMSPWFHSDTFTVALAVTASYKADMPSQE